MKRITILAFFCEILATSPQTLTYAETTLQNPKDIIKCLEDITKTIPEKPGLDGNDQAWDNWRSQNYETRKNRIDMVNKLRQYDLSDIQLKPYLVMQLDDIESCFYYARNAANSYEGMLYRMMESKNLLEKMLSTELFWSLNIYHVNTHLMHLSEEDIQQIADFEMSRKEQPEAGRLMAKAIDMGGLNRDARVNWSTWILDKMPSESEGYQLVLARNSLKTDIGKVIEFNGIDLAGNVLDIKEFRGKVVLIDYWAFWCGFCLEEIPLIRDVYCEYYDKGFRVIGVFNDYRVNDLKKYVKDKQIQWPQLINPDASKSSYLHPLAKRYGISCLPCYLLIDKEGKLIQTAGRIEHLKPAIMNLLK